jgi:hypothetical protein
VSEYLEKLGVSITQIRSIDVPELAGHLEGNGFERTTAPETFGEDWVLIVKHLGRHLEEKEV